MTDVVERESAAERLNLFPPPKLVERLVSFDACRRVLM